MIADFSGSGLILLEGSSEPADILTELSSGTELSLDDSATLTLFYFTSSEEYVYSGPAKILIEPQQPNLLSGKQADTRNLNMKKLAGIAAEDEEGIGLGVLKLRNFSKPKLELKTPVDTKVSDTRPIFTWSSVDEATGYEFILSNELGKRIADITLSETSVQLPEDIELSDGEEYTWEVIAQTSEQTEYRAHAYFSLAEDHVRQQVASSRPAEGASFSERLVYARLLEKLGLKHDAKLIWQELAALKPTSDLLQARSSDE
jgi:hypothetical protein